MSDKRLEKIKELYNSEERVSIVVVGPMGAGKSWLIQRLAFDEPALDATFQLSKELGSGKFHHTLTAGVVKKTPVLVAEVINIEDDPFKGAADMYLTVNKSARQGEVQ